VERPRARFSTWYELFPRSCATEPGRHGTFQDCIARLPYIAAMGFDVLYLPPIHPIGTHPSQRQKQPGHKWPGDPGSPWAIGGAEGGHTAFIPNWAPWLISNVDGRGAMRDRDRPGYGFPMQPGPSLCARTSAMVSPRPDGSIQYAENPPKKYQDIYPLISNPIRPEARQALLDMWYGSGSIKASASSGSTIRTPNRCASGSG
jgi:starch synthase (maltosyl-transferring)